MIIFGTRGRTSSIGNGIFHCPRCGPERPYDWQRVKTWFTLYFIPIFPVYTAGEYIECKQCAGTFGVDVLSYNPDIEQEKIRDHIKRILVLTAMSEGTFDTMRIASLQAAFAEMTDIHLDDEELRADYRLAREANAQLHQYVRAVADEFSDQGKQQVLSAAFATLADRGGRGEIRNDVLRQLGAALGMSKANVEHLLERMNRVQ